MNNTALEPLKKLAAAEPGSDESYFQQVKDFFLRYYIGISDFRGKGPLVDCGLPHRIEKYLSLLGKVLVIELTKEKLFLARLSGELKRDFIDKKIIKCDFTLIDDDNQETYQVRETKEGDETKIIIFNSRGEEDITFNPSKMILFVNNEAGLSDQTGIEFWLTRCKKRLDYIDYDANKCRKKMAVFTKTKMANVDKQDAIDEFESNDYIFNISFNESGKSKGKKIGIDPRETNYKICGPENSQERNQLWTDYREYISELSRFHGVIVQASFKQERQNIPETAMLEAPYKAWEKERKQVREESYRQCEKLGWIEKGWELNYGVQSETNEQKIKKLEEELKLAELEEKLAQIRQNRLEQKSHNQPKKEQNLKSLYETSKKY